MDCKLGGSGPTAGDTNGICLSCRTSHVNFQATAAEEALQKSLLTLEAAQAAGDAVISHKYRLRATRQHENPAELTGPGRL